jgi:hypothetical protein
VDVGVAPGRVGGVALEVVGVVALVVGSVALAVAAADAVLAGAVPGPPVPDEGLAEQAETAARAAAASGNGMRCQGMSGLVVVAPAVPYSIGAGTGGIAGIAVGKGRSGTWVSGS